MKVSKVKRHETQVLKELHGRDKHKQGGQPILCSNCGMSGGTLVKVDDHYQHQDIAKCRLLALRRPIKRNQDA